jgi:hypothetical protein
MTIPDWIICRDILGQKSDWRNALPATQVQQRIDPGYIFSLEPMANIHLGCLFEEPEGAACHVDALMNIATENVTVG